jgi:hypothetical protein
VSSSAKAFIWEQGYATYLRMGSALVSVGGGGQAQTASPTGNAVTTSQEELDQVIVRGGPKALAALRQEMIRLEERYFERYNELNTVDDFDVHCDAETSAGTKLKRRRCQANYMRDALAAEGAGHLEFLKKHDPRKAPAAGQLSIPGAPPQEQTLMGSLPQPAIMDIEIRRKEYQQNLIDVSKKHPELAKMLSDLSGLNKRYEAIQRSRR